MYNFILFKNARGTAKLNLKLSKGLNSLVDLTEEEVIIINYICDKNNYNFTLSSEADLNSVIIDEKAINIGFISNR